jgi:hypothetical protein
MGGGFLDVAQRHPGIKRGGNKCVPKGVRGDGFGDPGAASDLADLTSAKLVRTSSGAADLAEGVVEVIG